MIAGGKTDKTQADVISFTKGKPISIDPDLKSFLDSVIIPALIQDALKEIKKKSLAGDTSVGAGSAQMSAAREKI